MIAISQGAVDERLPLLLVPLAPGRDCEGQEILEQRKGVWGVHDLKMQMRLERRAGVSNFAQRVATAHDVAGANTDRTILQVRIERVYIATFQDDVIATQG